MCWMYMGSTYNDSFFIDGVDIFTKEWNSTGKQANVVDPIYGVMKTFPVWKVESEQKEITFVAGEFSNGIFGIWQPK